jgi:hypothetical protein
VLTLSMLLCFSAFMLHGVMTYLYRAETLPPPLLYNGFLRALSKFWIPHTLPAIPLLYLNRVQQKPQVRLKFDFF